MQSGRSKRWRFQRTPAPREDTHRPTTAKEALSQATPRQAQWSRPSQSTSALAALPNPAFTAISAFPSPSSPLPPPPASTATARTSTAAAHHHHGSRSAILPASAPKRQHTTFSAGLFPLVLPLNNQPERPAGQEDAATRWIE
jgi:hypothetical protein